MRIFLATAAALVLAAVLLRLFLKTPATNLARLLRRIAAVALLGLAALLVVARQPVLALPVGWAGIMLLRGGGSGRPAPGGRSQVRSAALDMTLDHGSGDMDGRVLAGRHAGRMLSELPLAALLELAAELRGDADSLRLLEGYLDRAHPAWREHVDGDEAAGPGAAARPGGMDADEAYDLLGLQPGAGEAEIREAHRRLMKQVHPDRGGSAALAAKINEAKERLLRKHR